MRTTAGCIKQRCEACDAERCEGGSHPGLSGRLGGAEMSRKFDTCVSGSIPLSTLQANVDYAGGDRASRPTAALGASRSGSTRACSRTSEEDRDRFEGSGRSCPGPRSTVSDDVVAGGESVFESAPGQSTEIIRCLGCPKRIKFRKQMRGKLKGNATRGNFVAYGEYGLQALEPHWISARGRLSPVVLRPSTSCVVRARSTSASSRTSRFQ